MKDADWAASQSAAGLSCSYPSSTVHKKIQFQYSKLCDASVSPDPPCPLCMGGTVGFVHAAIAVELLAGHLVSLLAFQMLQFQRDQQTSWSSCQAA